MIHLGDLRHELALLLPGFLVRQRWYAGDVVAEVVIEDLEVLTVGPPALVWVLARVPGDDAAYQVPVGLRPIEGAESWLEGKGRFLLGDLEGVGGGLLAYDALIDPELVPFLVEQTAPGAVADTTSRALAVEQSNTTVIVGEAAVLKLFRRVQDGPNPDAELVDALARVGFDATPEPMGTWRRNGHDLAVLRRFVSGATDGWLLATASVRDLIDCRLPPAECGGDFAPEAERLGVLVATMHLALASALGVVPGDAAAWGERLAAGTADLDDDDLLSQAVRRYAAMALVADPGAGIRVHGDLHLGQVLRSEEHWLVLDFEGEPRLTLDERRAPTSPLRDVAGMLRSFHYVAEATLAERGEVPDDEQRDLVVAWEDRNASAFLGGYLNEPGIEALLPASEDDLYTVLGAFELGKAVYELGYERAHRPSWMAIPQRALDRLLRA